MIEQTANSVSRRNVLKTTGGLLAGTAILAGTGTAQTEEGLQFEIKEASEEVITARVHVPEEIADRSEFPGLVYLGHVDQFGIDGDTVRLPEETYGLANPVEMERLDEETFRMHFRIRDIDFSEEEGKEVTLGLGVAAPDGKEIFAFGTVSVTDPSRGEWETDEGLQS